MCEFLASTQAKKILVVRSSSHSVVSRSVTLVILSLVIRSLVVLSLVIPSFSSMKGPYTCEDLCDEEDERAQPVEHVVHIGARKRASDHIHHTLHFKYCIILAFISVF